MMVRREGREGGRARGGRTGVIYQEFDVGRSLDRGCRLLFLRGVAVVIPVAAAAAVPLPQQSGSLCIIARERRERASERRDEEETRLIVRSDPEIKNMMKRRKVAAAAAARRRGRSGARNRLLGKTIAGRISRLCCMEYVALLSCPDNGYQHWRFCTETPCRFSLIARPTPPWPK